MVINLHGTEQHEFNICQYVSSLLLDYKIFKSKDHVLLSKDYMSDGKTPNEESFLRPSSATLQLCDLGKVT